MGILFGLTAVIGLAVPIVVFLKQDGSQAGPASIILRTATLVPESDALARIGQA